MDITAAILAFCMELTSDHEQRIECSVQMTNCVVPLGRDADQNDLRNCKKIIKKRDLNKSEEEEILADR